MIRVDFHYIKKKLLKRTFREWRDTLEVLSGEENVITDEVRATINKCVSKQIRKDVKDIDRTFKLINRRRKQFDKLGQISDEYEFCAFMNELGINTGNYFNGPSDDNLSEIESETEEENPDETVAEAEDSDGGQAQETAGEDENPSEAEEQEQTG